MRLLALSFIACLALLSADVSGKFTGSWTSRSSGNSGALYMTFTPGADGAWTAESSFTIQGQEVKTKPVSVKISGDQVNVVFAYDIAEAKLHSIMTATLTGDAMKGKYVSQDAAGTTVDEGTWEATRK